mmetsp:Transcript_20876/g.40588  ORF Transcript_20876/g.40588 Transcript_20876/m.40588 type:complete len:210 (+) Transcript_20876:1442-2071(+)
MPLPSCSEVSKSFNISISRGSRPPVLRFCAFASRSSPLRTMLSSWAVAAMKLSSKTASTTWRAIHRSTTTTTMRYRRTPVSTVPSSLMTGRSLSQLPKAIMSQSEYTVRNIVPKLTSSRILKNSVPSTARMSRKMPPIKKAFAMGRMELPSAATMRLSELNLPARRKIRKARAPERYSSPSISAEFTSETMTMQKSKSFHGFFTNAKNQ